MGVQGENVFIEMFPFLMPWFCRGGNQALVTEHLLWPEAPFHREIVNSLVFKPLARLLSSCGGGSWKRRNACNLVTIELLP